MMHCRHCIVIMCNDVCICFPVSILAYTHKQTTTQHTDKGSSVAGYVMIKEYDGKKERKEERRKKRSDECALCTMSRGERNGKNERVCYIFGCAQWQSISNSVQIRAVNTCRTWYVIFYTFLSIIYKNVMIRWMGYMGMRARSCSQTKTLILGDLGYDTPSRKEKKIE